MNTLTVGASNVDLFLTTHNSPHTPIVDNKVLLTLGDKIPTDIKSMSLGGNGANVSVGLARLGISSQFYTYLGNDVLSLEIQNTIDKEGVKLLIEKERGDSTSFSLIFDFDHDRVIFSHHAEKNYGFSYESNEKVDFIYLTSIGKEWRTAYKNVLKFALENNISLSFSPGSHQLKEIDDFFFEILKNSQSIFINKEEAQLILEQNGVKETEPTKILLSLQKLGPQLISITDGARGAYALDTQQKPYFIKPIYVEKPIEKTGAGDSYAAGFIAAYLHGKPVPECMQWGMLNAYSVMQKTGAQKGLLTQNEMEEQMKTVQIVAKPLS